jgi:predicted kinase
MVGVFHFLQDGWIVIKLRIYVLYVTIILMNRVNGLEFAALDELPRPQVILGVGIPGSGKSTVLGELASERGYTLISPDSIREELTGDAANQSVNGKAWDIAYERARHALKKEESIVIDATYSLRSRRLEAINICRSVGAASMIAVHLDTPLSETRERNRSRDRVVPDHALVRMHQQLINCPISLDEGFDTIITIR